MEYRELVAVTGLGGLFQLLTTKSDGAIVRSISDKTTKFISARTHNVTPLESIEIYTTSDNIRLQEVFKIIQEKEAENAPVESKSDNNAIKKYFETTFPDFDYDRVYVSDMKKILKWYELLKSNDMLHFENTEETAEPVAEVAAEKTEIPEAEEKPAKKPAAKKTTRKKKSEQE